MMVHLTDYEVPVADAAAGVPNLRETLAGLTTDERKLLLELRARIDAGKRR